jgi:hypothetical protein
MASSLSSIHGKDSDFSLWKHDHEPITVAERSKALNVFAHSNAGILGSNSTVCAFILCLCCYVCV